MTKGKLTYPEIGQQAEAMAAAWEQLAKQQNWVQKYFGNADYDEVIFIGSGSSYYQAQTMAATFRYWLARPANALPSSDIFLFRDQSTAATGKKLLVGVSRSGESTEVILAIDSVKNLDNWDTCGITCYEESSMAKQTECLVSPLGKEKSTVMTKSFVSMTFMMQAAIAAVANGSFSKEMKTVLDQAEAKIAEADAFAKNIIVNNDFIKTIYLGMGSYFGIAQEACLKLKEMSYTWTESYGTLEFRHGPKSIIEPGSLVVLLLSETARSYELKVAEEMKAYGAYVLIITARAGEDTAFADAVFEIGASDVSDEARAVMYLPLLQYIGFWTAVHKDIDPDEPRNLTQVVKI